MEGAPGWASSICRSTGTHSSVSRSGRGRPLPLRDRRPAPPPCARPAPTRRGRRRAPLPPRAMRRQARRDAATPAKRLQALPAWREWRSMRPGSRALPAPGPFPPDGDRGHQGRPPGAARAGPGRGREPCPARPGERRRRRRPSGCLSKASSATGAKSSAATRQQWRAAGFRPADCDKGRPALSSASMPQRPSKAETRAASIRSGVTKAAVWPGVSSASRRAKAMAVASAAGSAISTARTPVRRLSAGGSRLHLSLKSAAVMAWATARPRTAGDAARPLPFQDVDFAARDPEPVEQQFQMILRMALLAAAIVRPGPARPIRRRA